MPGMNQAQWVDRVLAQLQAMNPNLPPEIKDDINRVATDALQMLGELIPDSPLRQILRRDFQCASLGGSCDLTTATLPGGASLASGNVFSIVPDSISRIMHPDSLEAAQPEHHSASQHVEHPKILQLGYIYYWLSGNALFIRSEWGLAVSDQLTIFKCSFAPTFSFFSSSTNADIPVLEQNLVSIGVRLVSPQTAVAAPGQAA
jgi:hypothetical protein